MSRIIKHDLSEIPNSFKGCFGLQDSGGCSCDMEDHCSETMKKNEERRP